MQNFKGGARCTMFAFLDLLMFLLGNITARKDPSDKYRTCYEEPGKQVLILYGTEYGFSEEIARKLFDKISDNQELVEVRQDAYH